MRFVYYVENAKNPIPDEILDVVDHDSGGISSTENQMLLVLTENLSLTEVQEALDADVVELTYSGEIGPGVVLVDKPGFRIELVGE